MIPLNVNRRGLNAIVVTLLFVIIVLVAIAILFVALRENVKEGTEKVDLADACLKIALSAQSCDYQIWGSEAQRTAYASVVLERTAGQGELVDILFQFTMDDGKVVMVRQTENVEFPARLLKENERLLYEFNLTSVPISIRAAAIVGSNELVCQLLGHASECLPVV